VSAGFTGVFGRGMDKLADNWLCKQMLKGLDWDLSSGIPNPPGAFGWGVERE